MALLGAEGNSTLASQQNSQSSSSDAAIGSGDPLGSMHVDLRKRCSKAFSYIYQPELPIERVKILAGSHAVPAPTGPHLTKDKRLSSTASNTGAGF